MIPLKDNIPNVHKPLTVWLILAANTLVFIYELTQPAQSLNHLIVYFGVIPARYSQMALGDVTGSVIMDLAPFVTYMFIHGGWLHFILNMLILWIFADNVEDVMGPARFLAFYLACGLAAVGTHMLLNLGSPAPVIGASGAIAGVMGAYFLLYPHARVVVLIPIFFIPYFIEIPAVIFLAIWFLMQVFSGLATHAGAEQEAVAFWAHVGGFVAGMALLPLFKVKERCLYCYNRGSKRYEADGRRFFE